MIGKRGTEFKESVGDNEGKTCCWWRVNEREVGHK